MIYAVIVLTSSAILIGVMLFCAFSKRINLTDKQYFNNLSLKISILSAIYQLITLGQTHEYFWH